MKYTVPVAAPRLATASTIRNSDMAVKKAPATALLKLRVMTTVSATVLTAGDPAPTRLSTLPRATSVSRRSAGGVPAGAAVGWLTDGVIGLHRRAGGLPQPLVVAPQQGHREHGEFERRGHRSYANM